VERVKVGAVRGKGVKMVTVNNVNLGRLDEGCKRPYREIGQMDGGA
jgi:hypothetical protein